MNFLQSSERYLPFDEKECFSSRKTERCIGKNLCHQCSEIRIGSLGLLVVIISFFYGGSICASNGLPVNEPCYSKINHCTNCTRYGNIKFAPTLVCIVLAGVVGSKDSQ